MTYYSPTTLLAAITKLSDPSNKDLRKPQYGATEAFNAHKRDLIVNYDEFNLVQNTNELQTKQIDYLTRDAQSVTNARAASLTGAFGTSLRDTVTFVTYAREFSISDSVMRNNTIAAEKFMMNQIINARLDLGAAIETAAVTKLDAFKNTVQGARTLGTWDSANYVSEIALANKTEYFNYMQTEMQGLNYNGILQEVHTNNANAIIAYQTAQGGANSANLQFQYPNFEFGTSASITNLSDYFCTSYVMEKGSLGLIDWIPGQNREGIINHGNWDFSSMPDPFGIFDSLALASVKSVETAAGVNGVAQDRRWVYELSVDVAFYIPTLTTGKLVNKYGLLSS